MVKTATIIFGIFFLVAGLAGFSAALAPEGKLFGLFMVGAVHNIIHIASGIAAFMCAFVGLAASRVYLRSFGIIYGLIAVLGVFYGDHALLGIVQHNLNDIWLHILIAAVALYLGFATRDNVPS